jgi:hypothetical protein
MHIFTDEFLLEQRKRWESRPEHEWPLISIFALRPDRANDRSRIEGYVEALHPGDQPAVAALLRNERQFVTTYGELLVAQLLIGSGLAPRYEQRFSTESGNVTPDWYVEDVLICEVFTAGLEKSRDADENALRDLVGRLKRVNIGCTIAITMPNPASTDAGTRKQLAAAVHRWLVDNPAVGSREAFGTLNVDILARCGRRVDVVIIEPMHVVVTPDSLKDNFEEKEKKYAGIGLPLIVAAVKHHRAEIDDVDIEDVIAGQQGRVIGVTPSGQPVPILTRLPHGLFETRTSLSAAIYIDPYADPAARVHVWANSQAKTAAPTSLLARMQQVQL